jgi:hypothetical protein
MGKDESEALAAIARAIHWLGNADAATPMGALEALGLAIKDGDDRIAESIGALAEAVHALAGAVARNGSPE